MIPSLRTPQRKPSPRAMAMQSALLQLANGARSDNSQSALMAKLESGNRPENVQAQQQAAPQSSGQGAAEQVAGTAGQVGGTAAAGYAANTLLGSSAAGAVPAAPTVLAVNAVPTATAGAGAASTAGTAAGTTAATTGTGAGVGSALGTAATYAWPLAAAYGAYRAYDKITDDLKESDGGPLTDSEIFYDTHPAGIVSFQNKITGGLDQQLWQAGLHPAAGPLPLVLQGILGTTKEENQVYRDRVRNDLKKRGVINENYELSTPGGNYNIGIEGQDQFKDSEKPKYAGEHRYDVDVAALDSQGHSLYGMADALANAGVMGDEKRRQQFAGYFMNAANVGGDPLTNMADLAADLGLTYDQAMTNLNERQDLSPEQRANYQNAINMLFKQDKYSDPEFFAQAYGSGGAAPAVAPKLGLKSGGVLVKPQSGSLPPGNLMAQNVPNDGPLYDAPMISSGGTLKPPPRGGMNPNPELGQIMPAVYPQQQQGGGRTADRALTRTLLTNALNGGRSPIRYQTGFIKR